MAVGMNAAIANEILDALNDVSTWTSPTQNFIKLHLGDPGANGTTNPAANTTREQVTWGAAAGGAASNNAIVEWLNVPAAETYTHISVWDDVAAGTFLWSDTLTTPRTVAVGDNAAFAVGDLDNNLTPLAA